MSLKNILDQKFNLVVASLILLLSFTELNAQFSTPIPAPGMGYELIFYHDNPYLIQENVLWKYNGTTYNPIGYPAGFTPQSYYPALVYNDKIYIPGIYHDITGSLWPKLYSYDGSVFQEIAMPSGKALSYHSCDMAIFQNKLFVTATSAGPDNDPNGWLIIDGTSVSFQNFPGQKSLAEKGMAVYNNNLCLIVNNFAGEPRLLLYDGTTSTLVGNPAGSYFTGAMANAFGDLYIKEARPTSGGRVEYQLVKYTGDSRFTSISNPIGYQLEDELEFHKDLLYTIHEQIGSGNKQLFVFNGSTYQGIPYPGTSFDLQNLTSHECRLYMTMNNGVPNLLYLQTLCYTIGPFPIFDCNRLFGCHLFFRFGIYGNQLRLIRTAGQWENAEGYPNIPFSIGLYDAKERLLWEEVFTENFKTAIPKGIIYQTIGISLGSGHAKTKILSFDKSYLLSGASSIELEFKPQEEYITFKIDGTKSPFPLDVTLLDGQGVSVWNRKFRAPFSDTIEDRITSPGMTLVFSSSRSLLTQTTEKETTSIRYYPNPAEDRMIVELTDSNGKDAKVTLHNMSGDLVYSTTFSAISGNRVLIDKQTPGIYIMTIVVGNQVLKERIEMK